MSQRFALVAMMLVLSVGAAMAQPGDGGRGPGNRGGHGFERGPSQEMMFMRCLGTLDLTREQRAAIESITTRLENMAAETREEIARLKQLLEQAREDGDRAAAQRIMNAIEEKMEALATATRNAHQAILDQLTDEQKRELRECMEQRGHKGDRGRHLGPNDCWAQIELTRDQMAEIKSLREQFQEDHLTEMQELRDLHRQLREARREGDEDAIAELRAEIAAKMEALKTAQERLRDAIHDVLTDEQQEELEECLRDRRGGRGGEPAPRAVPQLD